MTPSTKATIIFEIQDFIFTEFDKLPENEVEQMIYYDNLIAQYNDISSYFKQYKNDPEIYYWYNDFTSRYNEIKDIPYVNNIIMNSEDNMILSEIYHEIKYFERLVQPTKNTDDIVYIDKNDVDELITKINVHIEKLKQTNTYVYYKNNPFVLYEGIIVPDKIEVVNTKEYITSIMNYFNELYNNYIALNKEILDTIYNNADMYEMGLKKYNALINELELANNEEIMIIDSDFYNYIEDIEERIKLVETELVTELKINQYLMFYNKYENMVLRKDNIFIEIHKREDIKRHISKQQFEQALQQLQYYILILESGDTNIYEISVGDLIFNNIKDLVEYIISEAKNNNYNIELIKNKNTIPEKFFYESYQTGLFLADFKEYYYDLVTSAYDLKYNINIENIYIQDLEDIKIKFLNSQTVYNKICSQKIEYMTYFEIENYIVDLLQIQETLKNDMSVFFKNYIIQAPFSEKADLELYYTFQLEKLDNDYKKVVMQLNKFKTIDTEEETPLMIEANGIVLELIEQYDMIDNILKNDDILVSEYKAMIDIRKTYHNKVTSFKTMFLDRQYSTIKTQYLLFAQKNKITNAILIKYKLIAMNVDRLNTMVNTVTEIYKKISAGIVVDIENINEITTFFEKEKYLVWRDELHLDIVVFYNNLGFKYDNYKVYYDNKKTTKLLYIDLKIQKTYAMYLFIKIKFYVQKSLIKYTQYHDELWYITNINKINNVMKIESIHNIMDYIDTQLLDATKIINGEVLKKTSLVYDLNILSENKKLYDDTMENYDLMVECITEIVRKSIKYMIESTQDSKLSALKKEWQYIIEHNNITALSKYTNEITNNIHTPAPAEINFSMKNDIINNYIDEDKLDFTWNFDNGKTVKSGINCSNIFELPGNYTVQASIIYPNGSTLSKYINVIIDDFQIPSYIKFKKDIEFKPLNMFDSNNIILTWYDVDSSGSKSSQYTLINDENESVTDLIDSGTLAFAETDLDAAKSYKKNTCVFGMIGDNYPTEHVNIDDNYKLDDIDMTAYMFAFTTSNPFGSVLSISWEGLDEIEYITKIPTDVKIRDLKNVKIYDTITHDNKWLKVLKGDILIIKNKSHNYAVVEITDFTGDFDDVTGTLDSFIKFDYYINTSTDSNDNFGYSLNSNTAETLVFNDGTDDIFNSFLNLSTIINQKQDELKNETDLERIEILKSEIDKLVSDLDMFYFYREKKYNEKILTSINNRIDNLIEEESIDVLEEKLIEIDTTKSILENIFATNKTPDDNLIYTINTRNMYAEYIKILSIVENIYNYSNISIGQVMKDLNELQLFENKLTLQTRDEYSILLYGNNYLDNVEYKSSNITYNEDEYIIDGEHYIDTNKTLISKQDALEQIIIFVREILYKLKLVLDIEIHSIPNYISLQNRYFEQDKDYTSQYLKNKKLELIYDITITNDENVILTDTLTRVNKLRYDMFGSKLSNGEIIENSKHIQEIEEYLIERYDAFFMFADFIKMIREEN